MSITGAMNAAITGLRAAARGSELVSSNISNALTPGYGKRGLELSPQTIGAGGVVINGISRQVNEGLVSDRRFADADQQNAQGTLDFLIRVEDIIGLAGDANGLSARLDAFETGLISAASRPDETERLASAVEDAKRLATGFEQASDAIQTARTDADRQIAADVDTLNRSLKQVQDLNTQITAGLVRSGDAAALMDQRQTVIDRISAIVPVRSIQRDNGNIALYSDGGAILIDPTASTIGFDATNLVTPFQTLQAGTLSGLTINDQPLRVSALRGGRLEANFSIRDEMGVEAQAQLDALARDLVERYQDPALDGTRAAGDPGLFTDTGVTFDPLNEIGLAGRLQINAAVDSQQGGESWRLRDGLGAAAPGSVGDATLLDALRSALNNPRIPASGDFGAGARGAFALISDYGGTIAARRDNAEQELSFASARFGQINEQQLGDGVDTDQELQKLLVLERAYAANARVIEAADEMLEQLLRF